MVCEEHGGDRPRKFGKMSALQSYDHQNGMNHSFVLSHLRFSFAKCSADAKNNSSLYSTPSHTRLRFDEPFPGWGGDDYGRARRSCKSKLKRW